MWGHDLRRVGRIDDAIAAFRRTDDLERAYYAAEKISPELDWHHVHNLDLLATAYQYKGQMRLAEKTLREMAAFPPVTDYLEFNQKTLASFLLDRGRAEEAIAAARKLSGRPLGLRARGGPVAGRPGPPGPRPPRRRPARPWPPRNGSWPRSRPSAAGSPSPAAPLQPWVDALRGEILLREGRAAEGRALLQDVQARLRAIPGPDAWIQALFRLEAIARLARDAGDWGLAEYTADQMIEHDTAYAGSHLATGRGRPPSRRHRAGRARDGPRAARLGGGRPRGSRRRGPATGRPRRADAPAPSRRNP